MSNYNINSGYGQVTANGLGSLAKSSGKTFFVVKTDLQYNYFSNIFKGDPEGILRTYRTVQEAVNHANETTSCDVILVAPGAYDEAVVIPRSKGSLSIVGCGNLGDSAIAPSTTGAVGLTFNNDGLTLVNMDIAGESTALYAVKGTGSRFRTYNCKLEGVNGAALGIGPGTDAAVTAGTAGNSGDTKIYDTEFAWSTNGIDLIASDYGVPTQVLIVRPLFHNISGTEILGVPGAFGIGSVRNLVVTDGLFDNMEDGTKPSDFVNVNTAFDTGMFTNNSFALATDAVADFKVGANIKWVANKTEAGITAARPA